MIKRYLLLIAVPLMLLACNFTSGFLSTPTVTPFPTITPMPTPIGGTSGSIIMSREEMNLSGNAEFDEDFYSVVQFNIVTNTTEVLLQSNGTDNTYHVGAVSSDGESLFFSEGKLVQTPQGENWNSILYQMDMSTNATVRLSKNLEDEWGAEFPFDSYPDESPDGDFLVYNSLRQDAVFPENTHDFIFVKDLQNNVEDYFGSKPQDSFRAKFSPDGKKLVFNGWDGSDWEIYTVNKEPWNPELQQITDNSFSDRFPDWSPDGRYLVFHSDRDGNIELYTYDLENMETRRLTNNTATDATANWSPDGKMIIFISDRDGDRDIYSINLETGEEMVIYNSVGIDENVPIWIP